MNVNISSVAFSPLIDSSDISLDNWVSICEIIEQHYDSYDGFVVLHGTDTMSFSASVVSFMLENLSKPVIFTGSQLPVGVHRSDAKENLITSIEIAAAKNEKGSSVVQEVCVFFEDQLMRGNRTTKRNAEEFDAFASFNYHNLAKSGVHIKFYPEYFWENRSKKALKVHKTLDNNIAILRLFPGINQYNSMPCRKRRNGTLCHEPEPEKGRRRKRIRYDCGGCRCQIDVFARQIQR